MDITGDAIEVRVKDALEKVGLNFGWVCTISSISVKWWIRRRIALACAFAMEPKILALDEPTAGLDSSGAKQVFMFYKEDTEREKYNNYYGITFFGWVTAIGRQISLYRYRVSWLLLVIEDKFWNLIYENAENHIVLPDYMRLLFELKKIGNDVNIEIVKYEEAEDEIANLLGETSKWTD